MGRIDIAAKALVSHPEVFADIFNRRLHGGEPVIRPEDLRPLDSHLVFTGGAKNLGVTRIRDLARLLVARTDGRKVMAILGVENQSISSRRMVVRVMLYDAMQYDAQFRSRQPAEEGSAEGHRVKGAAIVNGAGEMNRIVPVLTEVVFYGSGAWEGPLTLRELMPDAPPELLKFVPDIRLHLTQPAQLTDAEVSQYRSDFGAVMGCLRASGDKESLTRLVHEDSRFRHLHPDAARVIEECTSLRLKLSAEDAGKGTVDMCKAIDDLVAESTEKGMLIGREAGRQEGMKAGREEGRASERLESCRRFLDQTTLGLEQIAACLNLPLETVRRLADEMGR